MASAIAHHMTNNSRACAAPERGRAEHRLTQHLEERCAVHTRKGEREIDPSGREQDGDARKGKRLRTQQCPERLDCAGLGHALFLAQPGRVAKSGRLGGADWLGTAPWNANAKLPSLEAGLRA
ncbi:MAG: hypothetical protein WDO17_16060 [Alphaproteobacteria bacterium]